MGSFSELRVLDAKLSKETLHIDKKKEQIKVALTAFRYIDKDTRQFVIYMPALEISAYGADPKKAEEMLKFSLDEYFKFLINLKPVKLEQELSALGWKKGLFKKNYSKIYIDSDGELKNFNAANNKVERLTLVA